MPKLAFIDSNVVMALAGNAGFEAAITRYQEPKNPHLDGIDGLLAGVKLASSDALNTVTGVKPQIADTGLTV